MEAEHERLIGAIDLAPLPLALVDGDGIIVHANDAFTPSLGRAGRPMVGRSLDSYLGDQVDWRVDSPVDTVWIDENGIRWPVTLTVNPAGEGCLVVGRRDRLQDDAWRAELERATALLRIVGDVGSMAAWEADSRSDRMWWSDGMAAFYDMPAGWNPVEFEASRQFIDPPYRELWSGDLTDSDHTFSVTTPTGRQAWLRAITQVETRVDGSARVWGTLQDVTDRERARRAEIETARRFEVVVDNLPDLVLRVERDLTITLARGVLARTSERLGWPLVGLKFHELNLPAGAMEEWTRKLARCFDTGEPDDIVDLEVDILDTVRWFQVRIAPERDANDQVISALAIATEVTARVTAERELARQALHDALTGLPNRLLVEDRLGQSLARARRAGTPITLFMIDLDHFKLLNETEGHERGDQALQVIAHRLRSAVAADTTVARFGGDEFVLVYEQFTGEDEAVAAAEQVRSVLREPMMIDGGEVWHTASVGVVHRRVDETTTSEVLLRDADNALHTAKRRGRDQVCVFTPFLHESTRDRVVLEAALRPALAHDQFRLHYQPILSAAGALVAVEALLRWEHPTRGLLGPGAFLDVAVESGLIVPLGRWVIGEAVAQLRHWQDADPALANLVVQVNLAPTQLTDPMLIQTVLEALTVHDLAASRFVFEVTEQTLYAEGARASHVLHHLAGLGITFALDDFGTGFSSLAHLQRFPLAALKIDKSFVDDLGTTGSGAQIVRAIVHLAHSLSMSATAEGVEHLHQLDELRLIGCDRIQGYYHSKPLPPEQLLGFVNGS